jgi:uncharacterized membrane protein YccC
VDLRTWRPHLGAADAKLVVRIVVAAAISWWLAELLGGPLPVFAAIVPMVALRADDPYGVIDVSLWRILGTMVGVLLGLVAVSLADPAPFALVVGTIAVGVVLGLLLRRPGDPYNAVVAVTAALVLTWGGTEAGVLAPARLWETALGGAVTIVVGIFLWPTDPIARLERLIQDQAGRVTDTLDTLAIVLGASAASAHRALDELIRVSEHDPDVMTVLAKAERGLRINPLRHGQRDRLPALAVRARTLGGMQRYTRSTVWDLASQAAQERDAVGEGAAAPALRVAIAGLRDAARAVGEGTDVAEAVARASAALDTAAAATDDAAAHEVRNDLRIVLRVLGTYAQGVLQARSAERFAP